MEIYQSILESIPIGSIGIVVGFLATKGYDLLFKRFEYKLEAKKEFYIRKIECGANACQLLEHQILHINKSIELLKQIIGNPKINYSTYSDSWNQSQVELEKIRMLVMEMFNKSTFYYNIDFDEKEGETLLSTNISANSEMRNMLQSKDYSNAKEVSQNYINSLRLIVEYDKKIKSEIKSQSTF